MLRTIREWAGPGTELVPRLAKLFTVAAAVLAAGYFAAVYLIAK